MLKNMFLFDRTRKKALTLHRHLIKKASWRGGGELKNTTFRLTGQGARTSTRVREKTERS